MTFSIKEDREELKISIMDDDLCYSSITCRNEEHYDEELENAKIAIKSMERIEPLEVAKGHLEEDIKILETESGLLLINWE